MFESLTLSRRQNALTYSSWTILPLVWDASTGILEIWTLFSHSKRYSIPPLQLASPPLLLCHLGNQSILDWTRHTCVLCGWPRHSYSLSVESWRKRFVSIRLDFEYSSQSHYQWLVASLGFSTLAFSISVGKARSSFWSAVADLPLSPILLKIERLDSYERFQWVTRADFDVTLVILFLKCTGQYCEEFNWSSPSSWWHSSSREVC